jgi:glycosyltransferase involved in cell wall biosynthesis
MGAPISDGRIPTARWGYNSNQVNWMKVLVFTSLYPNNIWPNHGVFIRERMTQFARLDACEVKVVAPVAYFPPINFNWRWKFSQVARREFRDGLEVHHPRYFLTPKVGMIFYGWMMFLSVLPVVKKIQEKFDFDIIDSHYVYPDGFAAIQLGRFFKKPVVVSARGSDINLYRTFPLIRKLLQYVLRNADGVIAVSRALKQSIVQLGIPDRRISIIPNGVDTETFYPMLKEQARRELGLQCSRLLLSVGNLTPNKGFDLLIGALPMVVEKLDKENVHLAIVGDGPLRNELKAMISSLRLNSRVHLVGAVPHTKLRFWYGAADVFCLASQREGWPNVILESLACGTPVVATRAGGIPEILSSNILGLLTERNEIQISRAILAALGKKWISKELVEHARNHSWNHTAVEVMGVCQSVLSARKINGAMERVIQA